MTTKNPWINHVGQKKPGNFKPGDCIDYFISKYDKMWTCPFHEMSWLFEEENNDYLVTRYRLSENQEVVASTSIEVNVTCPECGKYFDLMENNNDEGYISAVAFGNDDTDLDLNVNCDSCKCEFIVNRIIY